MSKIDTKTIRWEFNSYDVCEFSKHHKMGKTLIDLCDAYDAQQKEIERLNKDRDWLHKKLACFYKDHHPNNVTRVVGIMEDGTTYALMIKNQITTNDGAYVEVYCPKALEESK